MATLFLAGDVMLGRGIDQLMPHASSPELYEPFVTDARDYVALAEQRVGTVPPYESPQELWGAAADAIAERVPDAVIINLETSITRSSTPDPGKGIHYRMHPANSSALAGLPADCAVLANNHVLDWGTSGLVDTLQAVERHGVASVGAGRSATEARRPAVLGGPRGGGRTGGDNGAGHRSRAGHGEQPGRGPHIAVAACAHGSSGVPAGWGARAAHPGVWLLERLDGGAVAQIREALEMGGERQIRICSLHWGGNWGYRVPQDQRRFAHALIDEAGVDIVYGHSSHHVKAAEVYRNRLILYGCGDFINDYEGIPGHEEYRPELAAGYFVTVDDGTGALLSVELVPFVISRFRLRKAEPAAAQWLAQMLNREGRRYDTAAHVTAQGTVALIW